MPAAPYRGRCSWPTESRRSPEPMSRPTPTTAAAEGMALAREPTAPTPSRVWLQAITASRFTRRSGTGSRVLQRHYRLGRRRTGADGGGTASISSSMPAAPYRGLLADGVTPVAGADVWAGLRLLRRREWLSRPRVDQATRAPIRGWFTSSTATPPTGRPRRE